MTDTPKLMVWIPAHSAPNDPNLGRVRDASVGEVVVWLREQGAGEEVKLWCSVHKHGTSGNTTLDQNFSMSQKEHCQFAPVLVIPLDTEPPKESE